MIQDNTLIYALGGEIDHHSAEKIRKEIDNIILEERPKLIIFDFSNVKFMDSSGIGLVLGRYRIMSAFGGKVSVRGASQSISRLFTMSGVDKIIDMITDD